MSKIKLVSGGRSFSFDFPEIWKKNFGKLQNLLRIFYKLGWLLNSAFIFLLPIVYVINYKNTESTMSFLLAYVIVALIIYFGIIILNGSRQVKDPNGFIFILVWGLLLTASSVFVLSSSYTNTFGVASDRMIGGLSVLVIVTLYYLYSYYFNSQRAAGLFFRNLYLGLVAANLLVLLTPGSVQTGVIYLWIVTMVMTIYFITRKFRLELLAVLVGLIGILGINFSNLSQDFIFNTLFTVSLVLVIISIFLIVKDFKTFKSESTKALKSLLESLKTRQREVFESINFNKLNLVVLPLLFIIATIIYALANKAVVTTFANEFSLLKQVARGLIDVAQQKDIRGVIFGIGVDKYIPQSPFIVNLLFTHGIVGVLSYVFVSIVAIGVTFKNYAKYVNKSLWYVIAFVILFVPIISLLSYAGVFVMILWWILFCYVLVMPSVENKYYYLEKADLEAGELKFNPNYKLRGLDIFAYIFASFQNLILKFPRRRFVYLSLLILIEAVALGYVFFLLNKYIV